MADLTVYHMPGSCSRITLIALEECAAEYEDRSVALMQGAQRSPAYLAMNPKGKVPTLVTGGTVITESPVILQYLAQRYPGAGLLPSSGNAVADQVGLSDLIWCAGVLHPLGHRIFRPESYTTSGAEGVKEIAIGQLGKHAEWVATRVASDRWWYGGQWSIVDAYLAWCFGLAAQFGFPLSSYPTIEAHKSRLEARPSFEKMRRREHAAIARDGLTMPPWYS